MTRRINLILCAALLVQTVLLVDSWRMMAQGRREMVRATNTLNQCSATVTSLTTSCKSLVQTCQGWEQQYNRIEKDLSGCVQTLQRANRSMELCTSVMKGRR